MPLYEFACRSCRDEFEVLVRNGDKITCPECGSSSLEKQFSVVAAHTATGGQLPMCEAPPNPGGCRLPQCGGGQCGMM